MSLSSSMAEVGHPVAYYPRLARFFGSVNAAIFFSQLYYWQERTDARLGVFKTSEEWADETGLSYREQTTARKLLVDRGFLIETNLRLEHKLFYRLDLEAIDNAFREFDDAQLPKCVSRSSGGALSATPGQHIPQVGRHTETTSETTSEISCRVDGESGEKRPQKPAMKSRAKEIETSATSALFEQAWEAYPARPGKSRKDALKAWSARLKAGATEEAMLAGVKAYAAYCSAKKVEPQYVKQPQTFFGPGDHYLSDWTVSTGKPGMHSGFDKKDYNKGIDKDGNIE